jgi:hypothetical protein
MMIDGLTMRADEVNRISVPRQPSGLDCFSEELPYQNIKLSDILDVELPTFENPRAERRRIGMSIKCLEYY